MSGQHGPAGRRSRWHQGRGCGPLGQAPRCSASTGGPRARCQRRARQTCRARRVQAIWPNRGLSQRPRVLTAPLASAVAHGAADAPAAGILRGRWYPSATGRAGGRSGSVRLGAASSSGRAGVARTALVPRWRALQAPAQSGRLPTRQLELGMSGATEGASPRLPPGTGRRCSGPCGCRRRWVRRGLQAPGSRRAFSDRCGSRRAECRRGWALVYLALPLATGGGKGFAEALLNRILS